MYGSILRIYLVQSLNLDYFYKKHILEVDYTEGELIKCKLIKIRTRQ